MVRNFGYLAIQVGNVAEEQNPTHNQMEEILKTLITNMNNLSNEAVMNNQKTLEIQNASSAL